MAATAKMRDQIRELEMKERSSKSLLANVLGEELSPILGSGHEIPYTPKCPLVRDKPLSWIYEMYCSRKESGLKRIIN